MSGAFLSVLKMSFSAGIVALVVMLARLCLRKAPKIFSYMLWLAVLVRLLCPVVIPVPISVLPEHSLSSPLDIAGAFDGPSNGSNIAHPVEAQDNIPYAEYPTDDNISYEITAPLPYSDNIPDESKKAETNASRNVSLVSVLAYVWLAGIVSMVSYFICSYIVLSRKLQTAIRISDNIYESDRVSSAFVLGITDPKIYLPTGLSDKQKRYVVLHERIHMGRCDHLIKYISFLALSIHWFNPVIWLSYALMCADMERSCDESVIKRLSGRGYDVDKIKKQYGMTLIALAERNGSAAPVPFAENNVKGRISNIMNCHKMKRSGMICMFIVCILFITACEFSPAVPNSDDTSDTSTTNFISWTDVDGSELLLPDFLSGYFDYGKYENPLRISNPDNHEEVRLSAGNTLDIPESSVLAVVEKKYGVSDYLIEQDNDKINRLLDLLKTAELQKKDVLRVPPYGLNTDAQLSIVLLTENKAYSLITMRGFSDDHIEFEIRQENNNERMILSVKSEMIHDCLCNLCVDQHGDIQVLLNAVNVEYLTESGKWAAISGDQLTQLRSIAERMTEADQPSGCPFDLKAVAKTNNGKYDMSIATDSCGVFIIGEKWYDTDRGDREALRTIFPDAPWH